MWETRLPGRFRLVLLVALVAAGVLPVGAEAATYTVNSTADTGGTCMVSPNPCTLRQAINTANASVGVADVINFSTPGPITVGGTQLPNITDSVTIDGRSNGTPAIQIDGTTPGSGFEGLLFTGTGNNSTVIGVSVTKFDVGGIDRPQPRKRHHPGLPPRP